jgi:hypothetical protein
VRQGSAVAHRIAAHPKRSDALSPRIETRPSKTRAGTGAGLERIERWSAEITSLVERDPACERLMTVPGIAPISSNATVARRG